MEPNLPSNFRLNFVVNIIDKSIFLFGESFASISTLLPVFVAMFTESPILIGLVPAIINGGWFLPQLFMSTMVQQIPKKMPLAKKMAVIERIPLFMFPVLPMLMVQLDKIVALWLFFLIISARSILAGMAVLPWQEVIATVIPNHKRGLFFGLSRLFGQLMGALGSFIAVLIIQNYPYPINFSICFFIYFVSLWVSYFFFGKTKEPQVYSDNAVNQSSIYSNGIKAISWVNLARIIKHDTNFRSYLISRLLILLGTMSTGFVAVYGVINFNLTPDKAAVFSSLLFTSGIFSSAFWSMIGDRLGPKTVLFVSEVIWILALVVAVVSITHSQYYGVFILMGFSSAGIKLGDNVLIMELSSEQERPYYIGMARTLLGFVSLIAPLLAGWLVKISDYPTMFNFSLLIAVVGLFFLWRVQEYRQHLLSQTGD